MAAKKQSGEPTGDLGQIGVTVPPEQVIDRFVRNPTHAPPAPSRVALALLVAWEIARTIAGRAGSSEAS
jgi:hypothetical protein